MPTTRSQAGSADSGLQTSAQPAEPVTSPRADPPRRVLRSRQGNAGVIVNLDDGGTSFIVALGDASTTGFTISRCQNKKCKTCRTFNLSQEIVSNVTHRKYYTINRTGENLNCHSQNIVYLCTCLSCNVQYVGETIQQFNLRNNGHRTAKEGCEHEIRHCKEACDGYNFEYQILEKLPGNGYTSSGEKDLDMLKIRKAREDEWIKKLRTIYPYGLNESASDKETDSSVLHPAVGKLYPPLPRSSRSVRSRGNRNNHSSNLSSAEFFQSVDDLIQNDLHNSFFEIRKILDLTKKKVLKEIAFQIMERDTFTYYENRFQIYHYILDIIDTKLLKDEPPVQKRKAPKNVISIRFVNKGLDDIHISKIFRSPEVVSLLPEALQGEDDIPACTMKLDPPIRSKILNYRETVSSLKIQVDEDVSFVENLPSCDCANSEFCDPHHKHIVSGDLRIISNTKLRKLFSKGPNYREPKMRNYRKCKQSIESSLISSVDSLAGKYNLSVESFAAWKNKILEFVDRRVNILNKKKTLSATKPVLQDEDVQASLSELHSRFVVVPIDKAANNVAIICKRFYIQKLLGEVGVPGNASPTYELSQKDPNDVINNNSLLCEKFGLPLEERMQTLPFMYWMPKMHYSPPRARFIIASSTCSTKPLSKVASSIFKHIFNQVRNFHKKSTFYKNYNRFWVIENSSPVIEKLSRINAKKNAKDISTYDFSTLYTTLPHEDLIKNLNEIVDFAFEGGNKKKDGNRKYITVTKFSTFWSRKKKGNNSFTKSQIKLLVTHLIKETYFQIGNLLFKQCIGIPMGIDPAPFWANLHLYKYEYDFIKLLMSTDKGRAMKFRNASRFIDDEKNLNDGGEFGRSYHQIYPSYLQLKCEHQGTHATFMDLEINVCDGIFVYKLYDKRDGFPFFIVRMPDLNGNIPSHVFYGSVMSEFLRIGRCTLLYSDFLKSASGLFKRMTNQGGSKEQLLKQISKAITRHPAPFSKFSKNAKEIMHDISLGEIVGDTSVASSAHSRARTGLQAL